MRKPAVTFALIAASIALIAPTAEAAKLSERETKKYSIKAFNKFKPDWREYFDLDECFRLGRAGIGLGSENFKNGAACRFIEKPGPHDTCLHIYMGVKKRRHFVVLGPATGFMRSDPGYCDHEPDAEPPPDPPGSKPF